MYHFQEALFYRYWNDFFWSLFLFLSSSILYLHEAKTNRLITPKISAVALVLYFNRL